MYREEVRQALVVAWDDLFNSRLLVPDTKWVQELSQHLEDLVEMRSDLVQWIYGEDGMEALSSRSRPLKHSA